MDCLDPGVCKGRKVEPETWGHRDLKEIRENKDWRGRWDLLVSREPQVYQDSLDSKELLDFLETPALLADREILDPLERTVKTEWTVSRDYLVLLVTEARLERMEVLVYRVWQDPWVL